VAFALAFDVPLPLFACPAFCGGAFVSFGASFVLETSAAETMASARLHVNNAVTKVDQIFRIMIMFPLLCC
jgi:hypothetical protein